MATDQTISVIMPVYNEERTLPMILEVFRSWGKAHEIIVVDDGSTDQTKQAIAQFIPGIRLISYRRNRGKGYALSRGIAASRSDILLLCDGDVFGLTHRDADALVDPVLSGACDMAIGLSRFWAMGTFSPFDDLSGQRALMRKTVITHTRTLKKLGYGVELFLNDLHREKRMLRVKLPFVSILRKIDKQALPHAVRSFIRETIDLTKQYAAIQASDLSPQAKRAFNAMMSYLKRALDYLPS